MRFGFVACSCLSGEPKQNKGQGLVEAFQSNFIAGRPKAALLFGFFGGFRYGVLLFMVILVIYKYKNR